jgi:hypothetical protein
VPNQWSEGDLGEGRAGGAKARLEGNYTGVRRWAGTLLGIGREDLIGWRDCVVFAMVTLILPSCGNILLTFSFDREQILAEIDRLSDEVFQDHSELRPERSRPLPFLLPCAYIGSLKGRFGLIASEDSHELALLPPNT